MTPTNSEQCSKKNIVEMAERITLVKNDHQITVRDFASTINIGVDFADCKSTSLRESVYILDYPNADELTDMGASGTIVNIR